MCLGLNTIYLVFPAFSDSLFAQNHMNSSLILRFAIVYKSSKFACDVIRVVSSANDKIEPLSYVIDIYEV